MAPDFSVAAGAEPVIPVGGFTGEETTASLLQCRLLVSSLNLEGSNGLCQPDK